MAAKDEICNQFCSEHPTVRQQETTIAKYPFAKTKTNELSLLHDEYHNPNEEEKAYHGKVDPCGSYQFTESRFKDAKTMMGQQVNMAMSTSYYTINGTSRLSQGNIETKTNNHSSEQSQGESGQQSAGATVMATALAQIFMHGGPKADLGPKASGSCGYETVSGDKSVIYENNLFLNPKQDHALDVGGTYYTTVNNGECGLHVQNGNYDVKSEKKTQHYSKDEMTIISDTKITLKVGQSQIIISPDNIVLKVGDNVGIKIMSDKVRVTKVAHIGTSDLDTDASNDPSPDTFFQAG